MGGTERAVRDSDYNRTGATRCYRRPCGVLLLRLQFSTHALGLLHETQRVLAKNLSNVAFGIAFAQQRLGDFRQLGAVFQAVRQKALGVAILEQQPTIYKINELGRLSLFLAIA